MSGERDEFALIAAHFAPLAGPEGLGLLDDVACLTPPEGQDLVITADALVAGVHFRVDDPPGLIARKALRVNLSDLAAKGAAPLGYTLTIAWAPGQDETHVAAFAAGLAQDQAEFGCHLLGGDTVSTPGPMSLSITALGTVPRGALLRRRGARPGDVLYVSGTIGDGALGLDHPDVPDLAERYWLPRPRLALGRALLGRAHAAMDVSDGLVADLGHLARASGVRAILDARRVPLSKAARDLIDADPGRLARALTGGDDYEILAAGPEGLDEAVGGALTPIGRIEAGAGVLVLGADGAPWDLGPGGWRHMLRP